MVSHSFSISIISPPIYNIPIVLVDSCINNVIEYRYVIEKNYNKKIRPKNVI